MKLKISIKSIPLAAVLHPPFLKLPEVAEGRNEGEIIIIMIIKIKNFVSGPVRQTPEEKFL